MSLTWIHDSPPHWDAHKTQIVGGAPEGIFQPETRVDGQLLPGEWWRVDDDGAVVGYGWMDCTWGDAEILLAVAPDAQKRGVGAFILDRLEREAAARGQNYMYNMVRAAHPHRQAVTDWLRGHGFEPSHDDDRLVRRVRGESKS